MTIGSEQGGVMPAQAALSGTGTEEAQGGGGGGGDGGGGNKNPTPPDPAPPACTPTEVTGVAPFQPSAANPKHGTRTILGLRARLSTDAARATIDVSASIAFKTSSGKSRTASLGSTAIHASGGSANYKVAIPSMLRKQLPWGTKLTLRLRYRVEAATSACSTPTPSQTRRANLRTKVVNISI